MFKSSLKLQIEIEKLTELSDKLLHVYLIELKCL